VIIGFLHDPRGFQAPPVTRIHELVVSERIRPAGEADKGDIFQVTQPKPSLPGQEMALRRGQDDPVLRDPPLLQLFAQPGHADDESGIEPADPNGFRLGERQHGDGNHFRVRLPLVEPAKSLGNDAMPRNTLHESNPKGAAQSPGRLLRAPSGLLNFREDPPRILQEQPSRRAQPDAPWEALEQGNADFFFQILYLAEQRGLRDRTAQVAPASLL